MSKKIVKLLSIFLIAFTIVSGYAQAAKFSSQGLEDVVNAAKKQYNDCWIID